MEWKTIASAGEGMYREKGSKFLAFALPVKDVEQAEAEIARIRKEYHDYRHICYAWRLGPLGENMKAHDAGEPAHSAGTPILNEIRSLGLTQVVVVVARHFGGTKLGIPGLIEAYKLSAREALENAPVITVVPSFPLQIRFTYEQTAEVRRALAKFPPMEKTEQFDEVCRMSLGYAAGLFESAREHFRILGILVED